MFPRFQKYLKPQVRTNNLLNSVVYHPCPSRLASKIHPFIFLYTLEGFSSLQNACWVLSDLYIPSCVGKNFQFMVFTLLENALNLSIFAHAPSPQLKTPGRIFWKSVSPKMKWVEETMICFIKIQSKNMKMTCNITLFIFCMICIFSKCDGFTVFWTISIK